MSLYRVLVINTTDSCGSVGCRGRSSVLFPEGRFMLTLTYLVMFKSHVNASIKGLSGVRYSSMVIVLG